jgi:hypothetical protein
MALAGTQEIGLLQPGSQEWGNGDGEGGRVTKAKVKLGAFAGGMLGWKQQGDSGSGNDAPRSEDVVRVIRFYLREKSGENIGWAYPDLLRRGRPVEEVEVALEIDESLWAQMESEAERQGVTVTRLLEHAALYYAAELDAGRLTERILDELDEE